MVCFELLSLETVYSFLFLFSKFDPDAPYPEEPTLAQIRHFVGGGFVLGRSRYMPGGGHVLFNMTPALSEYVSPGPPTNSSAHRYVLHPLETARLYSRLPGRYTWLLFEQPANFPTTPFNTSIENFNITEFAEQVGLGNPVGGNFMTVSSNPAELAAAGETPN